MQRERNLRLQCEGGMAACEHQLESIIRKRLIHLGFLWRWRGWEWRRVVLKSGTAQAVDGTSFGGGGQPRASIARNTVDFPAFQGIDQRVLQGILRQHEIPKLADEGGQDAPVFFTERRFNL